MKNKKNKQHLVSLSEIILLTGKPKHIILNFQRKGLIRSLHTNEGIKFDLMPTILAVQKHKFFVSLRS